MREPSLFSQESIRPLLNIPPKQGGLLTACKEVRHA
jgi:hypothetical protein